MQALQVRAYIVASWTIGRKSLCQPDQKGMKLKELDDYDQSRGGGHGRREDKEKHIWDEYQLSDLVNRIAGRKWM